MKFDISVGPNMDVIIQSIERYIHDFQTSAYAQTKIQLRKLAEDFKDRLVKTIERQELKWKPLSEDYLAQKIREGLDPRTLIATGEYVSSIYIEQSETKKAFILTITVPDREHENSGINLRLLAKILEFGSMTRNIPARPHWRPVSEKFIDENHTIDDKLIQEVMRVLKK